MKKGDKLYKVTVYELCRGGNHEDRKKLLFTAYEHAYSSRQAIAYVKAKHPRLRRGYDDYYGSESIDYIFEVERDLCGRLPKKVSQIDLFDNKKDLFEYEKKGK